MKLYTVLIVIALAVIRHCDANESTINNGFQEIFYWDYLDFEFPPGVRKQALASGSYIPQKNSIWAIEVWRDRLFISLFRYEQGVVSTLNYVKIKSKTKSPRLIPYPSFEDNYINEAESSATLYSNSSIVCTAHFRIEHNCNRLWLIDQGLTEYGTLRVFSPLAIIIFDLLTDKLVRRIPIPPEFYNPAGGFLNLVIDSAPNCCDDAYAYLADGFRSIVVYSFRDDRMWKVEHNYFGSDPHAGNFFYENLNFQWNYGVYGMALGGESRRNDGSKRLYVSPLSSNSLYYVSTRILKNESYIAENNYFYNVHYVGDRGDNGQVISFVYDSKTGILFNTLISRNSIGCWNTATEYQESNQGIIYHKKKIFYPADLIIDNNRKLWMLSSRVPQSLYGKFEKNVKNMQIFVQKVDDAFSGTICEPVSDD